MKKLNVGVVGATRMVGQKYVSLLEDHPWFQVAHLSDSTRSAGITYAQAVAGRWMMSEPLPEGVAKLIVHDAADVAVAQESCHLVIKALAMEKSAVGVLEERYAAAGLPVISNNSAHRHSADVPVLIPEINPHHAAMIPSSGREKNRARTQKKSRLRLQRDVSFMEIRSSTAPGLSCW